MIRLASALLALLALSSAALAQTRPLPPGEIRANGDITFGNTLKLGKREGTKTVITPDTLRILGPGSTGDASTFDVSSPEGRALPLARTLRERVRNWTEFGPGGACEGNAVADTAAFQAAFAAGGRFTLKCSQPILLNAGAVATKWVHIEAERQAAPIKLTAAFPQNGDVLTLRPAPTYDGSKSFGWRVAGLKVDPQVNGRGRHGIVVDLTAGDGVQLTGLAVEHNQVGDVIAQADGFLAMGAAALRFIPHPSQADQFYVSTVRQNYFVGGPGFTDGSGNVAPGGGFYARRLGDSFHFDENWVKGYGRGIDVEYVAGAANATIHRNNLTTSGGAIRAKGMFRGSILDNQIELFTAWTGDADQALVVLEDSDGVVIDLNNISANLGANTANLTCDGISLKGTSTRIDIRSGNRNLVNSALGRVHLRTAAGVSQVTWHPGQRIENPVNTVSTRAASVLATSIATPGSVRGLWFPLTLANGWVNQTTGGATYEGISAMISPDGRVSLRGNVVPGTQDAGTIITTLPAGDLRPAKTMRVFPKQAQPAAAGAFPNGGYLPIGVQIAPTGELVLTYPLVTQAAVSFDDTSYNPTAQ